MSRSLYNSLRDIEYNHSALDEMCEFNDKRMRKLIRLSLDNIHKLREDKISAYKGLLKYKPMILANLVDLSDYKNMMLDLPIRKDFRIENKTFCSDISTNVKIYTYMVEIFTFYKRIKKLTKLVKALTVCLRIPQYVFKKFILHFNLEVGKHTGLHPEDDFDLKNGLGAISFRVRDRVAPMINWDATNNFKKQLIADGIPLYSKDNPTGVKYLCYTDTTEYMLMRWNKPKQGFPNVKYYSMHASRYKGYYCLVNHMLRDKELTLEHVKKDDVLPMLDRVLVFGIHKENYMASLKIIQNDL